MTEILGVTLSNTIVWLVIGAVFLLVELIHQAWMIIWFSIGALAAAIVSIFMPEAMVTQVIVFAAMSGASLAGFVYYRYDQEKKSPPIPIFPQGRNVRCVQEINGRNKGLVLLDGVRYKARLENGNFVIKNNEWAVIAGFEPDDLTVIVGLVEEKRD